MLINLTNTEREGIIAGLHAASAPSLTFAVLMTLSTAIAAFGLLANSTAVVIGAMLIAPLMGPIFGITLSLIRGERNYLFKALLAETLGVLMAVGLAVLIGLIPLRPELGVEILSRTQPTLFDLLIALFSGLAGAFALLNPRISPTIAGVAIATALVPPLAACGICLAAGHWRLGGGAFLLFFVNFLAIQFAAAVVFLLANLEGDAASGGRPRSRATLFLTRFGPGLALLLVIGVFLTQVLVGIVTRSRMESRLSGALARLLGTSQGAQLSASHFSQDGATWEYVAEVVTPQQFEPAIVGKFQDELTAEAGVDVHLILRSLISRDYDRSGPVFISDTERTGLSERQAEADLLRTVSEQLARGLGDVEGAVLTDVRRDESAPGLSFMAVVQSPAVIEPSKVGELKMLLERQLGRSTTLIVRTIQTRDADSDRFVLADKLTARPQSVSELAQQTLLETNLRTQLGKLLEGAELTELHFTQASAGLAVNATVTAPRIITAAEVGRLQAALRSSARADLRLTLKTIVQATADAQGYLHSDEPEPAEQPGQVSANAP
jgi:uncharacterized hydrophobic protein (TIGR00271 family)